MEYEYKSLADYLKEDQNTDTVVFDLDLHLEDVLTDTPANIDEYRLVGEV